MQRIAWTGALALALLAGCQAEDQRPTVNPAPPPPLSTRAPEPITPLPPPPRPAPRQQPVSVPPTQQPLPRAGGETVRLADILPRGGIARGRWRIIVVHHSAASNASPQGMDSYHRQRGWSGGLGYHFVIGNGVNYPDGQVFVGPRWKNQATGAHCKNTAGRYLGVYRDKNFFNDHGVGICLIGDFQTETPSPSQLRTLRDLITLLVVNGGIPPSQVYGHGEITNKTACPGRNMNMPALRRSIATAAADAWDVAGSGRELEFRLASFPLEDGLGCGHDACAEEDDAACSAALELALDPARDLDQAVKAAVVWAGGIVNLPYIH